MASMLQVILDEICLLLETYRGRDKVLRTLCYTTKLVGGIHKNKSFAKKLLQFSSQMSGTRATLRLLDDLPMLQYNLQYQFGHEEPDKYMAQFGVLTNIIDQVYYPIEKISWLAEHKLITGVDNNRWDSLSSICWVASIYLTLLKSLRYLSVLQKNKYNNKKDNSIPLEKMNKMQIFEILTSIRLTMDLVHAINTLPQGFLWSSKLSTWQVGLIGSMSSVLGIYQIFYKRKIV
ncbi:unnamed protein product [Brassicogethes aeneus]|uniref:Peroxisomal membrane protein 11C n=1 Tax=Brassicogethes aeneus TaxID=1431903 RepID=A0A9P0B2K5_BRAAE|nr:unnamed protein product [Brassicogethes aeneus]